MAEQDELRKAATPDQVRDNPTQHRFELELDGATAFVTYSREPGRITFIHTEVPQQLGGRGVGTALARGALEIVRRSGDRVVPKCPFIAAFIGKHAEFQDLLADPSTLQAEHGK